MTNTNDFRRYSYQHDTSYMLDGFNLSRSSAAPKRKPSTEVEETPLKVRENVVRKSSAQLLREEKASAKKAVLLLLVASIIVGMVGFTIHSFALKNELTRQVSSIENEINLAKSEGISLQSKLDSMVSISMIDDYAVNKLNMTKVKSNQIQYIDVNEYSQNRMNNINSDTPDTNQELSNNNN